MRRILCIDGGGLKGALPAALLAEVEDCTGKRIVDQFDLIAGTSTGGIIALGLAHGLSAREIFEFYERKGPGIFSQPSEPPGGFLDAAGRWLKGLSRKARHAVTAKYSNEGLKAALKEVLGDALLADAKTRLVVPAYDSTNGGPYVFKTAHHSRLKSDFRRTMVDAALCTAAAPTFLPAYSFAGGTYIVDGGMWANNPAGPAALEAATILGWDMPNVRMLSLGCSYTYLPPKPKTGFVRAIYDKWIIELLMGAQSSTSLATAKLLLGHPHSNPHLIRIDPQVPIGFAGLDDANKIAELAGIGRAAARKYLPQIEECFFIGETDPFASLYRAEGEE